MVPAWPGHHRRGAPGLTSTVLARSSWRRCCWWPSTPPPGPRHWLFVGWPIFVAQIIGPGPSVRGHPAPRAGVPGIHVDGSASAFLGRLLLTLLNSLFADVVSVSDDDSYYSVLVRRLIAQRQVAGAGGRPRSPDRAARRGGTAGPGRGRPSRPHAGRRPDAALGDAALHPWPPCCRRPRRPARRGSCTAQRRHPGFPLVREGDTGRFLVANHPGTRAAVTRTRISDGHGLLATDGASIGNLFTGDAPRSYLTMATIRTSRSRPTRACASRLLRQHRATTSAWSCSSLGEVLKELYQAERQRGPACRPACTATCITPIERAVDQRGAADHLHRPRHRGDVPRRTGSTWTTPPMTPWPTTAGPSGGSPSTPWRASTAPSAHSSRRSFTPPAATTWWSSPTTARAWARASASATASRWKPSLASSCPGTPW